ncbi:synovial sarcoma, X breakpoint 2 interacting protein a isoform X2 [Electrophorus electricus]|uniref:synovial sarcoma, X breakpoint 2 interacting protein a isoform X2 n=1 Tax=Electrophorus electricus TaxID=8005 RepID=UPI0015D0B225|nr:synovial sarcoma, X breakpoint 2 interacting protein a isoform X2 [Electrophorus electricus]
MGDWWTPPMMPDPGLGIREFSSVSHIDESPSRHRSPPATRASETNSKHSYSVLTAFCTEENIPQCVAYVNQEAAALGLCGVCVEARGAGPSLGAASALNLLYELLQLQRRGQRTLHDLETQQLKNNSDLEHLQHNNSRLKDQLEHTRRENSGLHEGERQLQLKIRTLQRYLKSEKEEVQKLQSIIASRATQYNHDAKRKERESAKLKERLNQLLVDKRDKRLAIEVANCVGRADGKRSLWKTSKMEARHEGEMYKALLSDYEGRHQVLLQENAELKKLLQLMKKDMVSMLSPRKTTRAHMPAEDSLEQAGSEPDDELCEGSRDPLEQMCEQAREQLANSIRLQWRRLKSHMQRLDSQVSLAASREQEEVISRREHEEAITHMKMELQQCTEFIQTQQQLLQQQLSLPCDEETAALLNDGYLLEEKERLKEEWSLFHEQKKNFEMERKNFTEAAIRLGHERKAFEEDRALWLKTQFLNMAPFVGHRRHATSESRRALTIGAQSGAKVPSSPALSCTSASHTGLSTPTSDPMTLPSTAELYRTLQLIPDSSQGRCASNSFQSGATMTKSQLRDSCTDCSIFSVVRDGNSAS